MAILELILVPITWLFAAGPVTLAVLVAMPIGAIAIAVTVAHDAFRMAQKGRTRFSARWRLAGACLGFVLLTGVVGAGMEWFRERNIGEPFRIPAGGMFPTLLIGDHLYVDQLVYRRREPQKGDVVVLTVARYGSQTFPADRRPDLPRERFVKRIVGVPGDTIAFVGNRLLVNGTPATETDAVGEFVSHGRTLDILTESLGVRQYQVLDSPLVSLPDYGPFVVEPGRYFVAGDNRDHSKDSRFFGTISREDLVAPTSSIYWSWDFNGSYAELPGRLVDLIRNHTRWSRIGLTTN